MYTQQVLDYLKKCGQEVDRKIALETGISLIQVHDSLKELEKIRKSSPAASRAMNTASLGKG